MNINDYFLLYHGKSTSDYTSYEINDTKDFLYIISLCLSVSRKNYEKIIFLDSFKNLTLKVNKLPINNLNELYNFQYSILKFFEKNSQHYSIYKLIDGFKYLRDEQIIKKNEYEKLISIFNYSNSQQNFKKIDKLPITSTKKQVDTLSLYIDNLKEIFHASTLKNDLDIIKNNLIKQNFSIGITGIMNCGKSTMLNALLGEEVLGSSVIPETANLTIVKYGQPKAKVFYWNKKEWNNIEQYSKEVVSLKNFIEETKEHFKDNFSNFIQEKTVSTEIKIEELPLYTSANKSAKRCNLIKYVELTSKLSFLKDGVQIVDTPGLDDPVIQREEITNDYLSHCDMMIHLMNVRQSATNKDIEFIIDALLYKNITKLLIVITRADMVSKEELTDVINYTKQSIEHQLSMQNKNSKLDYILEHIKFIALCGKDALLHKIDQNKSPSKIDFTLEQTGILEIEEYIENTISSVNDNKKNLLIKSTKNKLISNINKEYDYLEHKLTLISKSKQELENELNNLTKTQEKTQEKFKLMSNDILRYKNEMKDYLENLELFIENELLSLEEILRKRVYDDVKYSLKKTKQKPELQRIKVIVQTTLKDAMVDLQRDYKYKFSLKTTQIQETCIQKYKHFKLDILENNFENFDTTIDFNVLSSTNNILTSKIEKEVINSKEKTLLLFNDKIMLHIKKEFITLKKHILDNIEDRSNKLIKDFFISLSEPLQTIKNSLNEEALDLKNMLESFNNGDKSHNQALEIHKNMQTIQAIKKELEI